MATCKLTAAVGATSALSTAGISGAKKQQHSSSSSRSLVAVRTPGIKNAFSHSEFLAKSGLSAIISSAAQPRGPTSLAAPRPVAPVCKLSKGDVLPKVATLKDQNGKTVDLGKFKGKPLVLYFYPADDSPGCTKQACFFRDSYEKFSKAGAEVVGISGDSPDSHKAFKAKYKLPFTLLSDENNKLRKDWGIPGDFFGSLPGRQTYVFDKTGKLQLIFNNQFQPEKHIDETLKVVTSF